MGHFANGTFSNKFNKRKNVWIFMYNLKDRVAVVTGSGRGIGREIAVDLAKNGVSVVVNIKKRVDDGNSTLREVSKFSSGIMVQADVSNRDGCRKLVDETLKNYGKCDILINNAGIGIASPFLESDDRMIEKTISTNLMSTIYCTQEFAKLMNDGAIVNVSSIAGVRPLKYLSIYGITKAGIISLTKYLAEELSEKGIRVNAIAPSLVKTSMGDSLLKILDMEENEYAKKYTLTGKMISPGDVSEAVLFLIRAENINGQTLIIDSGQMSMDTIFHR